MSIETTQYNSSSLHELNVGKYLNIFTKQKTMKIAFVCNKDMSSVKIFKTLQLITNIDYAIKNVCVTMSTGVSRNIPGDHFRYMIREDYHSLPLKNKYDRKDLRGTWAKIEIEIDAINNQKVDLFSAITHVRKSIL